MGNNRLSIANYLLKVKGKRELTEQIEIMVAGRAGVMLMLAVAAQGLLVIALATEVFDSLAGEEHNKRKW